VALRSWLIGLKTSSASSRAFFPAVEMRDQECTAFSSTCCTTTLMALGTADLPGYPQTSAWHLQGKKKRVNKNGTKMEPNQADRSIKAPTLHNRGVWPECQRSNSGLLTIYHAGLDVNQAFYSGFTFRNSLEPFNLLLGF
jgi:hypothetical protein